MKPERMIRRAEPDRTGCGSVEAGGLPPVSLRPRPRTGAKRPARLAPVTGSSRRVSAQLTRLHGAGERGFTLLELLLATAVLALLASLAVPPLRQQIAQHRVRLAAAEVAAALWTARAGAVRHGVAIAVHFDDDEAAGAQFRLYADGDGDGVRTADRQDGTDPQIQRPARLLHVGSGVRFGFPDALEPRSFTGSGVLDRLDDPVRFGRSDLASFSPFGTASPGSVFLTDGYHLFAVRVHNRTGKIQIVRYVREREEWKEL